MNTAKNKKKELGKKKLRRGIMERTNARQEKESRGKKEEVERLEVHESVCFFRREKVARKGCLFSWRLFALGWDGREFGKGEKGRRRVFIWWSILSLDGPN
jgi:hypothetical protein